MQDTENNTDTIFQRSLEGPLEFANVKKVVLLAINAKYVHSSLAVWLIAVGVFRYARMPFEVSIVETTIEQPSEYIAEKVAAHEPDVVGISTYIWNACKLSGLLAQLGQKVPGAVIVLGGPEASNNAEYWLARGADHVLSGEGEYAFPVLLDALAERPKTPALEERRPQTAGWQGAEEKHLPDQIDPYIDPYTDEYFAALGGRIAYLETSRGCPFDCAFCLSGGSGVRFFPVETAKRWINRLSQSGARTIKLVDRTFNCNADRAYELFDYVIGLDTACRFHFEVAADLFDESSVTLLGAAPPGRIQLEAGLQSYSERALKAASRRTDILRAERNIRALLEPGNIHIHIDLIAGLPHETLPEIIDGFDRAYALGAHTLQLGFLKLLHGSALRRQADALGIRYSEDPPYQVQSSPWLSETDIRALELAENALRHTYNKRRFLLTLEYALSATGQRPFAMLHGLGASAGNHGLDLPDYAERIYSFCAMLPGVDKYELSDCMTRDWLGMVKGKNMPGFLKNPDISRGKTIEAAQKRLGRKIRRDEAAVLLSGKGVFVDSERRDPVTGLYQVYYI